MNDENVPDLYTVLGVDRAAKPVEVWSQTPDYLFEGYCAPVAVLD